MRDFGSLTQRGRARRFRRALEQALAGYPIRDPSVRFVSMESKPVFRVDAEAGRFAAKFHDPREHELTQMAGEMEFLGHVSGSADLRVETPFANRRGGLVTEITTPWLPEPAHLALCTWVPGRLLRDALSVRSYRLLGDCAARLHAAADSFRPGADFRILTNDRVFYWDAETLLTREDPRHLPPARQALFRQAAGIAHAAIQRLWDGGQPIVIHNDLHPSNIKVARGRLSVFDFEDVTWGFPEQDLGTAMYYVRFRDDYEELRDGFRERYERVRAWPFRSDADVDPFVTARLLMLANYVVNYDIRPAEHLPKFEKRLRALAG